MLWCDPEFLGVYPFPVGSRFQDPENPWMQYGMIRNVQIQEADDPVACLSFSVEDIAAVLDCHANTIRLRITKGTIPRPIFPAVWDEGESWWNSMDGRTVYVLPEARVLLRSVLPKDQRPKGSGGRHNFVPDPDYLTRAILEVRAMLTERIDL